MGAGVVERTGPGGAIVRRVECAPMPRIVRHGLIAVGSVLWFAGLWAQLHSTTTAATYVVLSALMMLAVLL